MLSRGLKGWDPMEETENGGVGGGMLGAEEFAKESLFPPFLGKITFLQHG